MKRTKEYYRDETSELKQLFKGSRSNDSVRLRVRNAFKVRSYRLP